QVRGPVKCLRSVGWRPLVRNWPDRRMARGRQPRHLNIIHQPDGNLLFGFQRWTRTARRQHDDLPGPQRRNHPFHDVARGVAVAHDITVTVDFESLRRDDFRRYGNVGRREADAVKLQLEVTLADEVARLLVRFEGSSQVASPRKYI